jgi:hypothetical protein
VKSKRGRTGAGVLELEVLILELGSVDGLASGSVVVGEVTTLSYANRSVKNRSVRTSIEEPATNSVPDPDPNPSDPYVFGNPESGSSGLSYGNGFDSGSGSFFHQIKIVRKSLIPTVW